MIDGKIVKIETIKHYPPETAAMIFWLKNRKKEYWRDKQEVGFTNESAIKYTEEEKATMKELALEKAKKELELLKSGKQQNTEIQEVS